MLWLGYDVETTGLDAKTDRITEIGWVLYEPTQARPISIRNELIWDESYPSLSPLITSLTGITDEMLKTHAIKPREAVFKLMEDISKCSHIVAHNAPFDKSFLEAELERQGLSIPVMKWIDTSKDVPYPKTIQTRKLVHLAAEHGFVNPLAHRAVLDVLTMLKIVSEYDPHQVVQWSESPTVKIKAMVTKDTKDLAKERGYRWDSPAVAWFKEIKEFQLNDEIRTSPFKIVVVENA